MLEKVIRRIFMKRIKRLLVACLMSMVVVCFGAGVFDFTTAKADSLSATAYINTGANVTATAAGGLDGGLTGGVTRYMQVWGDGLKVSSSTTTGTIMSNAIDLSKIDDSVLIRFFPCDMDVSTVKVKIIDVTNTNNFIKIDYVKNVAYNYTYNGNTMSTGVNTTIVYKTSSGYATTASQHEAGQVLGTWWPFAHACGNSGGAGFDIGDGRGTVWHSATSNSFFRFSISYNKDTKMLSTTRNNIMLSDFVGFSGNNVYVQLSWTSDVADSGLLIDCLADIDFTTENISDNNRISTIKASIPDDVVIPTTAELLMAGNEVDLKAADSMSSMVGNVKTYCQHGEWQSALKATCPTDALEDGQVKTDIIDLKAVGSANLIRFFPADMNVLSVTVKIVDATNISNYILIDFVPSETKQYTNDVGTMSLGSVMTIKYNTPKGYIFTDEIYEYGLILDWWWPAAWIMGNNGGFGADIEGTGNVRWVQTRDFDRFAIAIDGNNLITTRNTTELTNWVGFVDDKAYVEVFWKSGTNKGENIVEQSGLMIDTIAGLDTTGKYAQDIVYVYSDSVEDVFLGDECPVPNVNIWSYLGGEYEIVSSNLYAKIDGNWIDKTNHIAGNVFFPDVVGDWKFVFVANDENNTSVEKEFVVSIKTFDIENIVYNSVYFVGETWSLTEPVVLNMDKDDYDFTYELRKDGNLVDIENLGVLKEDDVGVYVITYNGISTHGAQFTDKKTFEVALLPVWEESYTINEGQGIGDLTYPELREEWSVSILIYAQGDDNKLPIAPVNMEAGKYVMEIYLIVEGRTENVKMTANLTVTDANGNSGSDSNNNDNPSGNGGESEPPKQNGDTNNNSEASSCGCGAVIYSPEIVGCLIALFSIAIIMFIKKKSN